MTEVRLRALRRRTSLSDQQNSFLYLIFPSTVGVSALFRESHSGWGYRWLISNSLHSQEEG
ncbi:hypothetical protein BDV41DRAFT_538702 [Aspergillus transmontanensis]|uniref:Uncharacterized protein n=1 Tax=Aspergillus transmontanensis TaxID=1034304 RepID=A0A5N6VX35_9EURO|nr:hypothetical protein BDV41DRAFT_538702 [Aspergillus transmontanensis]